MIGNKIILLLISSIFILFFACGPEVIIPNAPLDTPPRHVENGMKLLKAKKFDSAFREFNRACELDSNYSPAYVGIGLVHGMRGNCQEGFQVMEKAKNLAIGDQQKAMADDGLVKLRSLESCR